MDERLMTLQEVAEFLNVPVGTVYQWRSGARGPRGPRGIKVGRHIRYRRADVDAWLEEQSH